MSNMSEHIGFKLGLQDVNGVEICCGDTIIHLNQSSATKPEYWYGMYQVVYKAPCFAAQYVGGGKKLDVRFDLRWYPEKFMIVKPFNTVQNLEALMNQTCQKGIENALWAIKNYPQPNYVAAKLGEEAGEVIRAFIHMTEGRLDRSDFEAECCQLIGLTLRLLHEGDETIKQNVAKVCEY
jgi:phosphoribosyl-ATP pyrophosphohydrolase